jgi:hypothetical protein
MNKAKFDNNETSKIDIEGQKKKVAIDKIQKDNKNDCYFIKTYDSITKKNTNYY